MYRQLSQASLLLTDVAVCGFDTNYTKSRSNLTVANYLSSGSD